MLKSHQDAQGHAFIDFLKGKDGFEIIERDDGYFVIGEGPKVYFSEYDEWAGHEKEAMNYIKGKVLDIGCGAGRHSLYLRNKGIDVMGIDISPLAIEVCKLRGLENVKVLSITQISSKLGRFDTVLMMGNNLGLFGNLKRARWLLKRLYKTTAEDGRIIAETRDPYKTNDPDHLAYHKWNRKRGRMPGQVRIRIRYKKYVTPWFDYLFVSKKELKEILKGAGWRVKRFIDGKGGLYIAIIEK